MHATIWRFFFFLSYNKLIFFGVPGSSGLGEVPVPQQQLQQPRRGIQTSPSGLVTNIPT